MKEESDLSGSGHRPVMLAETMEWLEVGADRWYVDANLGGGGHSRAVLERGGKVLAIDRDSRAVEEFRESSKKSYAGRYLAVWENNAEIARIVRDAEIEVSGILFDLGWSTIQGEDAERGLSFSEEGPLDMRLDAKTGETAGELLDRLSEGDLVDLLVEGDEPLARPIARALVEARKRSRLPRTTTQLAAFISGVYYRKGFRRSRRHPATRVFMALRIRVNREYENLIEALSGSREVLRKKGGRLLILTFHSGEDRIVKRTFREWVTQGSAAYLFRKSIQPGDEEIRQNPRARSARMRGVLFGGE